MALCTDERGSRPAPACRASQSKAAGTHARAPSRTLRCSGVRTSPCLAVVVSPAPEKSWRTVVCGPDRPPVLLYVQPLVSDVIPKMQGIRS